MVGAIRNVTNLTIVHHDYMKRKHVWSNSLESSYIWNWYNSQKFTWLQYHLSLTLLALEIWHSGVCLGLGERRGRCVWGGGGENDITTLNVLSFKSTKKSIFVCLCGECVRVCGGWRWGRGQVVGGWGGIHVYQCKNGKRGILNLTRKQMKLFSYHSISPAGC